VYVATISRSARFTRADELLRRAYFFVKLQAAVNAIPFLLLGFTPRCWVGKTLTMQVPPPGANVFLTRRRTGSHPTGAFVHLVTVLRTLRAGIGLRHLLATRYDSDAVHLRLQRPAPLVR
jgi:hypothetical protein